MLFTAMDYQSAGMAGRGGIPAPNGQKSPLKVVAIRTIRSAAPGKGIRFKEGLKAVHFDSDSEGGALRVVLADGDPLARRTIRDALQADGITVVAEATTGREAVELTAFYRPDAVIIDASVPEVDCIEVTRILHERSPGVCVIVLAAVLDDTVALRVLRLGASGYLEKTTDPELLPRVLRGALEGEAAISRRLAMTVIESYRRTPRGGAGLRPVRSPLTDREWEVLDLLAGGAGTEDIARALVLSTETVRSHLKNLYRKLGVRSREDAVEAAHRLRDPVG
jgi:DNA-binding NarL/FixJ family response regulator